MQSGWVALHRKLIDWQWYRDSETVHLFIHLLLKANHKKTKWRDQVIKRGSLITSRAHLSESTGISEQSVRTILKRLKSTNEITIKSTNEFTVISICNYDIYQFIDSKINQRINQRINQSSTNHQPTINHKQQYKEHKELNKEREGENIPPSFSEIEDFFQKLGVDDYSYQANRFYNHFESIGWKVGGKSKMENWQAAAKNWISRKNENTTPPINKTTQKPSGYNGLPIPI